MDSLLILLLTFSSFRPPVGGPIEFNGAVGVFEIVTSVDQNKITEEEFLTFNVRIRCVEKVVTPPSRPNLSEIPDFREQFYIEIAEPASQRPDEQTWEFIYRLRPRTKSVNHIPSLKFIYFNPAFGMNRLGYQTIRSESIPLTVSDAKPTKVIPTLTPRVNWPESVHQFANEGLLERDQSYQLPSWNVLLIWLMLPPVGCLLWFFVWRQLYPDAAHRASRRRSRAARVALASLHEGETAEQVAETLTAYLQHRLDFSITSPTPIEVNDYFNQFSFSSGLREETSQLFQTCDALRYGQISELSAARLIEQAREWVLNVENEAWSLPS